MAVSFDDPSAPLIVGLAKLARSLFYIGHILEDEDGIAADQSWLREKTPPPKRPKSDAEYAIENLQELDQKIHDAEEIAESLPDHPLVRDARAVLCLAHESLGQCDVPAQWAMTDGHPDEAGAIVRRAIMRAYESSHDAMELLAAKLSVCCKSGLPMGGSAEGIGGANEDPLTWPPASSWAFVPGKATYKGVEFQVSGVAAAFLQRFVKARRPLGYADLKGLCSDDLAEDVTIRAHVAKLRKIIRKAFNLGRLDPLPLVAKGGSQGAWELKVQDLPIVAQKQR